MVLARIVSLVLLSMIATALPAHAQGASYPAPRESDWIVRDFRCHGGEAAALLTPAFAGELFGAGQPLDASRYFIIIPDAIGHGGSSKPSDGLRMRFPHYNYADMEEAMKRLQRGRYVLLPISAESRGHGTTGRAALWKRYLAQLLAES